MIRLSLDVAFLDRVRDVFTDWSVPLAVGCQPGETILFARGADDPLRVLVHFRTVMLLERVFLLCFDKAMTDVDSVQFVAADAAVFQFPNAGRSVAPLGVFPHKGQRKGPISRSDEDHRMVRVPRIDRYVKRLDKVALSRGRLGVDERGQVGAKPILQIAFLL